jgi:hypothetical protein
MTTGNRPPGIQTWFGLLIIVAFLGLGFLTSRAGHIENGPAETTFPIIAFEVAGSGERAEEILSESVASLTTADADLLATRDLVEEAVRRSLWWDFGFIVAYSLLIFLLAPALGRRLGTPIWRRLGTSIGWSGLVAGSLDVTENAALFQVLEDTARDSWARVAAVVSWGKWVLVVAAISYGVAGVVSLGIRRAK